jgi:NADH dehydrogenase [ubiquinone] 1 alpha subcomplex assembly factor 7
MAYSCELQESENRVTSPLGDDLKRIIAQEGPISLERFMALALGDPRYGYYMTRDPFGASGDFTTSPEISQMFGELLGLWCVDLWLRAGSPAALSLVELGPGRGTLMSDMLRATKAVPGFHDALTVTLVEMSPVLREVQKTTLRDAHRAIDWAQDVSSLPKLPTLILANEFFDALPIRQYQKQKTGWHERLIGLNTAGDLAFGLAHNSVTPVTQRGEDGDILEYSAIGMMIMEDLASHLAHYGGAGLAIDYGYLETQIGDTLQAMKAHAFVDPLEAPGEADITTHVDFQRLAHAAQEQGLATQGPITQADLLERLGLATRAETLLKRANAEQAKDISSAVARLTERTPQGMGHLFKALAFHHSSWPVPAGF